MLHKQQQILAKRLRNTEELSAVYAKCLQTGNANVVETSKINLELLNVKTEASLNETTLRNKIQELTALDENIPVMFEDSDYPAAIFPASYEELKTEVLASDYTLQALNNESAAAHKQIIVNKSQWLPKLELGYHQDTESNEPFNRVIIDFSFPLFENHNKVKIAKAQSLDINLQRANTSVQVKSELTQLYRGAHTLRTLVGKYEKTFQTQQDLSLPKQAPIGGQISMIEYFAEVSVVYQGKQNYLQLENRYQKVMAKIYKNKL